MKTVFERQKVRLESKGPSSSLLTVKKPVGGVENAAHQISLQADM